MTSWDFGSGTGTTSMGILGGSSGTRGRCFFRHGYGSGTRFKIATEAQRHRDWNWNGFPEEPLARGALAGTRISAPLHRHLGGTAGARMVLEVRDGRGSI